MKKINLPIDIEKKDLISPRNPDFSWLLKTIITVILIFIAIYLSMVIFSYSTLKFLSLEKEKEIFWWLNNYIKIINTEEFDEEQLSIQTNFKEKYNIFVNKLEDANAFASVWANISINKWLIESLEYEEELLFVIWHEIAHIENRDMLRAILKEIPFSFALNLLGFDMSFKTSSLIDIVESHYSRKVEMIADNYSANFINELWMNLNCSLNFFKNKDNKFTKYLNLNSSHPTDTERIKNLKSKTMFDKKECTPLNYNFK